VSYSILNSYRRGHDRITLQMRWWCCKSKTVWKCKSRIVIAKYLNAKYTLHGYRQGYIRFVSECYARSVCV